MTPTTLTAAKLQQALQRIPEDSLSPTRAAAVANIDEFGLPNVRDEDWKYTDLSKAFAISGRWIEANPAEAPSAALDEKIAAITARVAADWIVIANGNIDLSRVTEVSGVVVELFSDSAAPFVLDKPLADLNAALLRDGVRLSVKENTKQPIGILVIDDATAFEGVSQVNVEISIDSGCEAEVIEYQNSDGENEHYCNSVISLNIEDDAKARYVRLQDRKIGHIQTGRLTATLGKRGELEMLSVDSGGGLVRNDVDINIDHPDSFANFNGLYLAGNDQHVDNHTRADHRVGPARSHQEYRGIIAGKGRGVWNGKAIVYEGADGTDAIQSNHNLLLSEHAEINAKPELEIYAEDVKCAHGTTVGQLDETALYYLRTRGIDEDQARKLLVHAFAVDLISKPPVAAISEELNRVVVHRLGELVDGDA